MDFRFYVLKTRCNDAEQKAWARVPCVIKKCRGGPPVAALVGATGRSPVQCRPRVRAFREGSRRPQVTTKVHGAAFLGVHFLCRERKGTHSFVD